MNWNSVWKLLFKPMKFPRSNKKGDIIIWVIDKQEQENARLKLVIAILVVSFISTVVTARLYWGWFV